MVEYIAMRAINRQRELVETEGGKHAVNRGLLRRLHFENLPILAKAFRLMLKISAAKSLGEQNAVDLGVERVEFVFDNLPEGFDNTRILLLTDFHIDGSDVLAEKILQKVGQLDYDYCVLGGDYSFGRGDDSGEVYRLMRKISGKLVEKSAVFGVLGNHDHYNMAELLDECGVKMLMNDSVSLERGGDRIYLAGLDDCHYFGADDICLAGSEIADGAFKVMVSHSPEQFKAAAREGYSLYMAGHTHGGQVCLPGGLPVVTGISVWRGVLKGRWKYGRMRGYTSHGVGASGVAVRFFCRPEMTVITLKCST